MRLLSSFGGILLAGIVLPAALSAQNVAHVSHVSVRDVGSAIDVEIHTTGTIASPNTQAITGPDRIVVDFPGALPASELRALMVNRGALKGVRSGLFFNNPPITRVVLDLTSAQTYQISQIPDGVVVRLGEGARRSNSAPEPASLAQSESKVGGARLTSVSRTTEAPIYHATTPRSIKPAPRAGTTPAPAAVPAPVEPPKPVVAVTFLNGMLRIHAEKATLAEVLFEVQRQTQAEIAIPAGAEQEQVVTDLGPAAPRDVLAALLNGSPYNFIFVGNEQDGNLGKVILSRRDPSFEQ
jgi:hypothetical protein